MDILERKGLPEVLSLAGSSFRQPDLLQVLITTGHGQPRSALPCPSVAVSAPQVALTILRQPAASNIARRLAHFF